MMRLLLALVVAGTLASATMPSTACANPVMRERLSDGFNALTGIATAPDGTVYVSNWGGGTVERISVDGSRATSLDGIASPAGIAIDGAGAVFVASYSGDYIVRLAPDGTRTQVAEGLATPTGLAFAADGRLLVANRAAGEVIAIDLSNGVRRVLAHALSLPVGVIEMADGSVVTSRYGSRVTRILADGSTQELGGSFSRPGVGIVTDGPSAVLVIDNGAGVVRRVAMDGRLEAAVKRFDGSAVALGRAQDGDLLIGVWGSGAVYRSRASR